jgi:hypothetical protein
VFCQGRLLRPCWRCHATTCVAKSDSATLS